MRILLVQVPTSHLGAGERVYPLGLSRLAGLVSHRFEKSVLDMNRSADPWPELRQRLESFQPQVVGLSFRNLDPLAGRQTSYLSSLKTAARMVRLLAPKARILAGGPAFSLFAQRLMEEIPQVDLGVVGEAEAVFPRLLEESFHPEEIPGLCWRRENRIACNPPAPHMDMDTLPPVDADAFRPEDYATGNQYVAAMGIEGKRGCDLRCAYCIYPRLGGGKMRLRSPEKIVDEMEQLHKTHGLSLFHFTDPVINRPEDHFTAICREILRRNLRVGWTGFFREDGLTEKTAALAVKAGLAAFYFSADALTDHGLKVLNKRLSKEDILSAAKITVKTEALTVCHFLMNLPGETARHHGETRETLERILDIHAPAGNLGAVILNNVRLYPGAPLTARLIKDGLLSPEIDLLYPVYYDPPESSRLRHELEARCHEAGVFSRLKIGIEEFRDLGI